MKASSCLKFTLFLFFLLVRPQLARASESLLYVHTDHLGSTTLMTDSTGKKVSKQVYYPYGETRAVEGNITTEKQYTGQVSDNDDTGLLYYNARYYSPPIGKFTQADIVNVIPNRYAYVQNNPVRFSDPSGHIDWDMLGEDMPDAYRAWQNYYLYQLQRKINTQHLLNESDPLVQNLDADNDGNLLLDSESEDKQPDHKQKNNLNTSNPYMITPQSSVTVGMTRQDNDIVITIVVIPNPKMNIAIDPFMKIVLPKGARKTSSFNSNQTGWGQIYYPEDNTFVIDNYNISFGNKFEVSFNIDVPRPSGGIIRIETWSDLYYSDKSYGHDQIIQSVDKIPLNAKNR